MLSSNTCVTAASATKAPAATDMTIIAAPGAPSASRNRLITPPTNQAKKKSPINPTTADVRA